MRKTCLLLIALWLLATQLPAKPGPITLLEKETNATIYPDRIELKYTVDNPSGQQLHGKVRIDLVAPNDSVATGNDIDTNLVPGSTILTGTLFCIINGKSLLESKDIVWYRVRVSIHDENGKIISTRTWSLSEITPDLFAIHVASNSSASVGQPLIVRVVAEHPVKHTPVSGVNITALLEQDEKVVARFPAVTNGNGWATINFQSIPKTDDSSITLRIEGVKYGCKDTYEEDLDIETKAEVFISNDKPIYQPGQTYRARLLAFTQPVRRALPSVEGKFEVKDEDYQTVFQSTFKTNEYGVASIDWNLADDLRLGEYTVTASLNDGGQSETRFKVSRYELPNFEVKTDSDRKFYLPRQDANVTISAQYLFGKPVLRGHVRVVQESERTWDYKNQKWDIKEEASYEGDVDQQGKFITRVKLENPFDDENDPDRDQWQQPTSVFKDFNFAAYFTDASTGRTEQRRFDLRVSREPLNVYITSNRQAIGLPLELLISAYSADGEPVAAQVTLTEKTNKLSTIIQTNRFGLAKYTAPTLLSSDDDLFIKARARDNEGRAGTFVGKIEVRDQPSIRITTDRIVYGKNQAIHGHLLCTEDKAIVTVDVSAQGNVQKTFPVDISNHIGDFIIPYNRWFDGRVTITAFIPETEYRDSLTQKTVLYPATTELKVKIGLSQQESRPGSMIRANLATTDPNGSPILAAMGLNVIDSAIEVRARTDAEFGHTSRSPYFAELFDNKNSIAGVSIDDLYKYDPNKPLPAEIELVAEALLWDDNCCLGEDYPYFSSGYNENNRYNYQVKSLFEPTFSIHRNLLLPPLEEFQKKYGRAPATPNEVRATFKSASIDLNAIVDPWGNPYQIWTGFDAAMEGARLISNGPDQMPGTSDDIVLLGSLTNYFDKTYELITELVTNYHLRTGKFISDEPTFRQALRDGGIDLSLLIDKWGRPYRLTFNSSYRFQCIYILSDGRDGKPATADDFQVAAVRQDCASEIELMLNSALYAHFTNTNQFPKTKEELAQALKQEGVDLESLRDCWGSPLYTVFRTVERFEDSTTVQNVNGQTQIKVEPVKATYGVIDFRSAGSDRQAGSWDDFTITTISQQHAEQKRQDMQFFTVQSETSTSAAGDSTPIVGDKGAIRGMVVDPNGAAIAGAVVEVVNTSTQSSYTGKTNQEGIFRIELPGSGSYKITVSSPGFKSYSINGIFVRSGRSVRLDVTLRACY